MRPLCIRDTSSLCPDYAAKSLDLHKAQQLKSSSAAVYIEPDRPHEQAVHLLKEGDCVTGN